MDEHNGRTILVVDDDPDLVILLTYLLASEGFRVLSAAHGLEALYVVDTQPVDLVLSDVVMPRCDGFELLERLKARDRHHPIVVLQTGCAVHGDGSSGMP